MKNNLNILIRVNDYILCKRLHPADFRIYSAAPLLFASNVVILIHVLKFRIAKTSI